MKRAVIFYNGDLTRVTDVSRYVQRGDFIICADGGVLNAEKAGVIPDVIVGDLDSLPSSHKEKYEKLHIPFVTFNREKDETDSELALRFAVNNGFTDIIIFGLFGTRIDHMLTNIFALSYLAELHVTVTIIEDTYEISVVKKLIRLKGKIGDIVSLIPLKTDAKNVTTKNLQYPLQKEDLLFGYSRGISNVFIKNTVEISLEEGTLLLIHYKR